MFLSACYSVQARVQVGRLLGWWPRARGHPSACRHLWRVSGECVRITSPLKDTQSSLSNLHTLAPFQLRPQPITPWLMRRRYCKILRHHVATIFTKPSSTYFSICHALSSQAATASTGRSESGNDVLVSSFSPGIVLLASAHLKRLQNVIVTADADSESWKTCVDILICILNDYIWFELLNQVSVYIYTYVCAMRMDSWKRKKYSCTSWY